jgi:aryl-alcohol dehydrogenase-like predicted oxidoreductase
MPSIGLGMAALGRPGYINLGRNAIFGTDSRTLETMQTQANLVLDSLFDCIEIPWIDCARSYGLSEKFTGEYLKKNKISPDTVYVSSKWGYSEFKGFSGKHIDSLFCEKLTHCVFRLTSLRSRLESAVGKGSSTRSEGPFR